MAWAKESIGSMVEPNPYAPWCWNIYQHLPEQNHPVM